MLARFFYVHGLTLHACICLRSYACSMQRYIYSKSIDMKLVRGRCVKTALTFMALQTLVLECVYIYHLNTQMARYGIGLCTCTLPAMPKAYQPLTPFTFVRLFPALEEINVVASFQYIACLPQLYPSKKMVQSGSCQDRDGAKVMVQSVLLVRQPQNPQYNYLGNFHCWMLW